MQDSQDTVQTTGDSLVLPCVAGWLAALLALAMLVLVPAASYWGVRAGALEGLAAAQSRALTLESILDRQRAVVAILAEDALVSDVLRDPAATGWQDLSAKLERLRAETQSTVLYLLDGSGRTVAASNWNQPDAAQTAIYAGGTAALAMLLLAMADQARRSRSGCWRKTPR